MDAIQAIFLMGLATHVDQGGHGYEARSRLGPSLAAFVFRLSVVI